MGNWIEGTNASDHRFYDRLEIIDEGRRLEPWKSCIYSSDKHMQAWTLIKHCILPASRSVEPCSNSRPAVHLYTIALSAMPSHLQA